MAYWDGNGLLNTRADEQGAENSMLFTYEYILLSHMLGEAGHCEVNYIDCLQNRNRLGTGLFKNHPTAEKDLELADQYMSHDTLTAMLGSSHLYKLHIHEEVWAEMERQWLGYNNLDPKGEHRWYHPRDLIYYGILNNNVLCWLLFPLFAVMCLLSMFGSDTTGKKLVFVRCWSMYDSLPFVLLYLLCTGILKVHPSFRGWKKVYSTYYPDPQHPINALASRVWKD